MTIDILSISAISAESEQIFSEAHCTISWERMQLKKKIIEKTECLKSWMHNDFIMKTEIENLEA